MSAIQHAHSRIHAWLLARTRWQRRTLAFAAGAVATLAHAPFQLTLLFALAVTILIWLLDTAVPQARRRALAGFGVGWWFGFGHMLTGLYWIASAFLVDSQSWGPLWGVPAALALGGGLGLFWGFGCAAAALFWRADARRLALFAAFVFAAEWLRGHVLSGFPWLLAGYVWTPGEPVSQTASLFGVYGLTLVTLLMAATPAAIADRGGALARFGPLLAAGLAWGLIWGWGAQRLSHAAIDPPGAQPVVRVADSGLSQAEKWCEGMSPERTVECARNQEWRVLDLFLEASGRPDQSRAAVVIWPEGAIPVLNFFALENPYFLDAIGQGLGDRTLILGLTRRENQEQGAAAARYYNSAVVIDGVTGAARLSQTYDKHHLVPFGEYIPLWSLISPLNIAPLQRIGRGFESGPPPTRLVVPGAEPALVLICYEAIFPGAIPRGEARPRWIVSITNDAWFGAGSGPWQHYAMARYRAIEEGLPLARAASGGVSAIVDSYGREIRATYGGMGFAETQLPPALVATGLTRYGETMLLGVLAIVCVMGFLPVVNKFKDS